MKRWGKLAVERTDKDQGVGSVAGVETGMEQLTDWYQQTNEMAEATDGGVSASDGTGEEDTTAKKS
ncbi:hypothetical protein QP460_000425 [Corynebacterium amycolatum]|uniref:Uncharacterized protein n=1 Tax=Corynebacterium amycolatum TaxID=43765 RepID=A0AAW9SSE7_CORAY|nr:hypothetical protein [Corynebacterium amycolatum]MDK7238167.1 hypothetical protein [Corynebacterium amycolatum]MDK7248132.1 hypothetical protein [Corynebacterium amycolatum]